MRAALWLAAFAVALGSPAQAQDLLTPRVTMTAQGFELGTPAARPGRALPLAVEISHDAPGTVTGTLQVIRIEQRGSAMPARQLFHERRLSLPPGKRVEVVHALLQSGDPANAFAIVFRPDGDDVLPPEPIFPDYKLVDDGLAALLVTDESDPRGLFSGVSRPGPERYELVTAGLARLSMLPTAALSYDPYELVVINDCELVGFGRARKAALLDWVDAGGWLVIAPGAQPGQLARSPLADILPLGESSGEVADRRPFGLARFAGGGADPELVRLHKLAPAEDAEVWAQDPAGWPLLVSRRRGLGRVTVAAFSLASPALQRWSARWELSRRLLPPQRDPAAVSVATPPVTEWLLNRSGALAVLRPPSVAFIAPLLLLYAVTVMPLSFRLAQGRRSPARFFGVAAGIIVATSAAVTGLTWAVKGNGSRSIRASLVTVPSRRFAAESDAAFPRAQVTTAIGLYFGRAGAFDMKPTPGAFLTPVVREGGAIAARLVEVEPGQPEVRELRASAWSFRRFLERGLQELGGLESELNIEKDVLVGRLANRTRHPIRGAVLVFGGQVAEIGDLAPGEVRELRAPLFPARVDGKVLAPFLADLLAGLETYHAFYPAEAPEAVSGPERCLRAFGARARGLMAPRGAPVGMLVGRWAGEPCRFDSGLADTVEAAPSLLLSELPLGLETGALRLTALQGWVSDRKDAVSYNGRELLHSVASIIEVPKGDPKLTVTYVFPVPGPAGEDYEAEELILEARFVTYDGSGVPERLEVQVYDAVSREWSKPLAHDAKAWRWKATRPERYVDPRTRTVEVRFRNASELPVDIADVKMRLSGRSLAR